ncbi:MAG: hypothetical protein M3Y59_19530 [Myxococcota bacterium]|nr:hypothetical protein [Myxococcota bacterium]
MKTDRARVPENDRSPAPKQSFQEALHRPEQKKPLPAVQGQGPGQGKEARPQPVATGLRAHSAAVQILAAGDRTHRALKEARGKHEATAETLVTRREELGGRVQRGAEERILERLKLEADPERTPSAAPAEPPRGTPPTEGRNGAQAVGERGPAPLQAPAGTSATSAVELVQKIEVWVKSSRPTLALTVGGPLAAEVTVERTGPGRVSLALRGNHGPPSHSDVRAVRDALEARGLRLTSVRIA